MSQNNKDEYPRARDYEEMSDGTVVVLEEDLSVLVDRGEKYVDLKESVVLTAQEARVVFDMFIDDIDGSEIPPRD
jgi:hypothetical protein